MKDLPKRLQYVVSFFNTKIGIYNISEKYNIKTKGVVLMIQGGLYTSEDDSCFVFLTETDHGIFDFLVATKRTQYIRAKMLEELKEKIETFGMAYSISEDMFGFTYFKDLKIDGYLGMIKKEDLDFLNEKLQESKIWEIFKD